MASREPFSRHPRQRDAGGGDGWDLARAAEFVADAFGWGPDYIDGVLTDEQLVAYLDAAQERIDDRRSGEFDALVEAVRVGTIFAHDAKQYGRWRSRSRNRRKPGLTGQALEQAIRSLAGAHPEYVVMGA